jgi:hypothetical protein
MPKNSLIKQLSIYANNLKTLVLASSFLQEKDEEKISEFMLFDYQINILDKCLTCRFTQIIM